MKTMMSMDRPRSVVGLAAILGGALALAGCGDDESGSGGAAGGGGASTSAETTTASTATTSSTPTSNGAGPGGGDGGAGEGGAGDGGAGGGQGGAGGAGGSAGACLEPDAFADLFTLDTDALCVVALHDAEGFFVSSYGSQPTWGAHGGLLTGEYLTDVELGPITAVDVTRWTAPAGASGPLEAETTEVDLTDLIGDDADFGGAQLVDLDDEVTFFAYTGADFANEGGLVFFDGAGALEIDLLLGGVGLGVDPSRGLPIYSSLGPVLDLEGGETGLFGSEPCGEGGLVCGGFLHAAWGDSSGPVTVDADGNVFAVMTSFDGSQTGRGFSATQIASGEETEGSDFFTVDGFGSPLAALAPAGGEEGLLVFQQTVADGEAYVQLPPLVVPYVAGDDVITAADEPATLLTPAALGAAVSLVSDDEGRLWVGVATETGTRFAVLARP